MATRAPKLRDSSATREAILDAARSAFTRFGYEGAGVREIAEAAACNAALVNRYFGGKEALFAEVMTRAVGMEALLAGPRGEFGLRLARHLLTKDKSGFDAMVAGLRSATSPTALAVVREELEQRIAGPLAEWLGGPGARQRAGMIVALMAGVDLLATVIGDPTFARSRSRQMEPVLARLIQSCVDG
jgi:AcrR family transcriptional regulator